jgi:hypothetical protein
MMLGKTEVPFVQYLVTNKIQQDPTRPLQHEALYKCPCVLPTLWTNKTESELLYFAQKLTPHPSYKYLHFQNFNVSI